MAFFFSKPRRPRRSRLKSPIAAVESLERRVLLTGGTFGVHIHPVLELAIDGQRQIVPGDIGTQGGQQGMSPVHTHDDSGTLHVESDTPREFRLGEFFEAWDRAIAQTAQGFGGSLEEVGHEARCRLIGANVQAFVDGVHQGADFESIVLHDGQSIVVNAITGMNANGRTFLPVTHDLALDLSANSVAQSSGTLVTRDGTFTIAGTTSPGSRIEIARDADGAFNDGTAVAAADGTFSIDVTLALGANPLQVRSTGGLLGHQTTRSAAVHVAEGTVVRFESTLGPVDFELLDDDAPQTVAAFLSDLSRYDDSFVHRSVQDFIIQGGGFTVAAGGSGNPVIDEVVPFTAPPNEFRAEHRNVRGTLSTAQLSGDITSFTGQFFVNVIDNPHLDNVPHAVFGRVIGTGMDVVDAINAIPTFNVSAAFGESALASVPLRNFAAADVVPDVEDFVIFNRIARVELAAAE